MSEWFIGCMETPLCELSNDDMRMIVNYIDMVLQYNHRYLSQINCVQGNLPDETVNRLLKCKYWWGEDKIYNTTEQQFICRNWKYSELLLCEPSEEKRDCGCSGDSECCRMKDKSYECHSNVY